MFTYDKYEWFVSIGHEPFIFIICKHCLGFVSYLLVIYYQKVRSYGAGMLTVLSNRIGNVALLIVIA